MGKTIRRVLFILLILVVVLGGAAGGVFYQFTRILPPKSFPQTDGSLTVAGLDQPVDIYRDSLGIPHIYASTSHDLFFAQGYVHAQDRFWQMDFWRHIGSGRLSEMFGKSQLDTDTFLRRMGWARVAQEEYEQIDADSKAILLAYAEGVNAYLKDHQGAALSLEYSVLKLLTPGYTVEPWTPIHTLTWAKAMAWDLRGNMDEEGDRAVLLKTFSAEQVAELYPEYPANHPTIVGSTSGQALFESAPQAGGQTTPAVNQWTAVGRQTDALRANIAALDGLLGPGGTGIGSNNWVISGDLTASGKPLLANDPHLGPQMPSIWYEIGLYCREKNEDCPFTVTGFSFAGAPGVVIGHNDRIAWGFTNTGPDVQDIYIEKINPQNPDQYEVNGQWRDMVKLTETIQVAGGDAVTVEVRYTRHGPILWEEDEVITKFKEQSGLALPENYRLSLRWTALDASRTFQALWKMNRAQNWEQFRAAAASFDVPAQNFVYADVDGNIGYQMPGKIPIRANLPGMSYVPGWNDEHEWVGFIPFEQLPSLYNPPEGYIVTANNAVVGLDYPFFITSDWDYGYRAQRIVDLIHSAALPIDAGYIQKMQGDNYNMSADFLIPALLDLQLSDANQTAAQALLAGWDGQQGMGSNQAALFEAFWKHLMDDAFNNKLPEDQQADGSGRWWEVVRGLIDQPESLWWDDPKTPVKETRDDIFKKAFGEAVAELTRLQGKDPAGWDWGKLHTITFRNKTLGESGVAPIESLFNRGPFPTAGGQSIVNATGWDTTQGYEVDWLPSMRMIVDLADLTRSLSVHTTGQSGHAYHPHYADMVEMWREIQYHPMRWSADDIIAGAQGHLRLEP